MRRRRENDSGCKSVLRAHRVCPYAGEVGRVDEEKIGRLCSPPAADTLVFVCGVPAMYEALCGPRGEAALKDGSVLKKLGYTQEMVFKF